MSDFSDAIFGPPAGVTDGWARLGEVLGGTGQVRQNAYNRGVMQGAQVADVMEQARRRRDQNIGFSGITPEVVQAALAGNPDARATLAASGLHAGINLDTLGGGLNNLIKGGQEQTLFNDATNGVPIDQLNARLAVLHGQPVKLTEVQGNTVINPYALPNQQAAVGGNTPTAVGQSDIGRNLALAEQARAGAFRNTAEGQHALSEINQVGTDDNGNAILINRLHGNTQGITDTAGSPLRIQPKGAGQLSDPKPSALDQAFGKAPNDHKPNPEYQQFKLFQQLHAADDPAYNNGDYALAQYMAAKSGTAQLGHAPMAGAIPLTPQQQAEQTGRTVTDSEGKVIASPQSFTEAMSDVTMPSGQHAPDAAPKAAPSSMPVGQTATNPKTGQKIRWNGQAWEPING